MNALFDNYLIMYMKWDYTAVEEWNTRYFKLYYNWKPIFVVWKNPTLFSLRFILDMWFEELK